MKRIFYLFVAAVLLSSGSVYAQAKKSLIEKSKKAKTASSKKIQKEEIPIVYNEDYEKAEEFYTLNQPKEAIPLYEKCIEEPNINPAIYIHLGVAYYQTGDFTRSLACCVKGLSKSNTDHKILAYNAGNSAYALTNFARAEASYTLAIKEDENFAPAYLNRANAQLRQDHLQAAKDNYIKYLELDPQSEQRSEIERLLALLEAEIIRRANEKPELISLDEMNVKNSSIIRAENTEEKVNYELPGYRVEEDSVDEELVRFEAPALPPQPEPELAEVPEESRVEDDYVAAKPVVQEKEVPQEEAVDKELMKPVEVAVHEEKAAFEAFVDEELKPEIGEKFAEEKTRLEEVGDDLKDVPDAVYTLSAGKLTILNNRPGFSPNAEDIKLRRQTFTVSATDSKNISSYVLEIVDEYGNVVKTMKGKKFNSQLAWDGKDDNGNITEGKFTARMRIQYKTGGSVTASGKPFVCATTIPPLQMNVSPEDFSPDGDGVDDVLKIEINPESVANVEKWNFEVTQGSKVIHSKNGEGKPDMLEWDGKTLDGTFVKENDKLEYAVTVKDAYDQTATAKGKISVKRSAKPKEVAKKVEIYEHDDGTIDIAIPTLSFKINSAELINNSKNNETLETVYNILIDENYEQYKVIITGYVNPDGEEWTKEEKLLALNRAKSVEEFLLKRGIPKNRLIAKNGDGKTENKEYNRRVEFLLTK